MSGLVPPSTGAADHPDHNQGETYLVLPFPTEDHQGER